MIRLLPPFMGPAGLGPAGTLPLTFVSTDISLSSAPEPVEDDLATGYCVKTCTSPIVMTVLRVKSKAMDPVWPIPAHVTTQ